MAVIPSDEPDPGHFEIDLVHHGCSGVTGLFTCIFQCIDVLSGWSERIAILGYEFGAMWRACDTFNRSHPIPVREIHTDNGPEFMNIATIRTIYERLVNAKLTRGLSGHKKHNRFVEQKNGSLVRAYLQSLYFHTPAHVIRLNALDEDMWLYYDFFQPVLRQTARGALMLSNSVCYINRHHDEAKTPLEHLLRAKPPIDGQTADKLRDLYQRTHPRELNRRIHDRPHHLAEVADRGERRKALYSQ